MSVTSSFDDEVLDSSLAYVFGHLLQAVGATASSSSKAIDDSTSRSSKPQKHKATASTTPPDPSAADSASNNKSAAVASAADRKVLNSAEVLVVKLRQAKIGFAVEDSLYSTTLKHTSRLSEEVAKALDHKVVAAYSAGWTPGSPATRAQELFELLQAAERWLSPASTLLQYLYDKEREPEPIRSNLNSLVIDHDFSICLKPYEDYVTRNIKFASRDFDWPRVVSILSPNDEAGVMSFWQDKLKSVLAGKADDAAIMERKTVQLQITCCTYAFEILLSSDPMATGFNQAKLWQRTVDLCSTVEKTSSLEPARPKLSPDISRLQLFAQTALATDKFAEIDLDSVKTSLEGITDKTSEFWKIYNASPGGLILVQNARSAVAANEVDKGYALDLEESEKSITSKTYTVADFYKDGGDLQFPGSATWTV